MKCDRNRASENVIQICHRHIYSGTYWIREKWCFRISAAIILYEIIVIHFEKKNDVKSEFQNMYVLIEKGVIICTQTISANSY